MLILCKLSFSQDHCLPTYDLPVQKLQLNSNMQIAYIEAGKGRSILLIHGLGGNISHWSKNVQELAKQYHVVAIDLLGYGHSITSISSTEDYLQSYAELIHRFIKRKKLKKSVLVGHSMGAQIAIITALSYPKKISKLILLAPAGLETFTNDEAQLLINATQPVTFQKQQEDAIRLNYKNNFYNLPQDAEVLIKDRLRLKNCTHFQEYTETISNGIKGMLSHPVKKDLSKLKQPVLIVFGANDALIPNQILHPSLSINEILKETASLYPM
jgi:pimeloyl-ACP methyl ester carboxylesterase